MKEYLEFILKQIVNNPEQLQLVESVEGTVVNIDITAAPEDMGLIIGKNGKTIRSIRALAKAKAIIDNVKVYVNIME